MSEYYLGIDLHKKRSFTVLMTEMGVCSLKEWLPTRE